MRTRSLALLLASLHLTVGTLVACGSRTGLLVPELDEESPDAGVDAPSDALPDAPEDALPDAPEDALPDAPEDATPACGPDTRYIYLVTTEQELYSYDPVNNALARRGFLQCPNPSGATPFSMGVDLSGTAYVVYSDGNLYRVSVTDASCEATGFQPAQQGFQLFGMGFALDRASGSTDALYVAEITFGSPSRGLATIDRDTLQLRPIGPFSENPGNVLELTSSSDGNLYGYFLEEGGQGGWLVEIDKEDATILSSTFLRIGDRSSALAFAFFDDDFYLFTSPGGATTVTRYRPADGSIRALSSLARTVVGAGVAPCDPALVSPVP